jgi:hypothetical protein
VLILPMLFEPFRPPKPENRIFPRYALDGHGYIFSCTVIIFHPQVSARSLNLGLILRMFSAPGKDRGGPARCGLQWLKRSEQDGLR